MLVTNRGKELAARVHHRAGPARQEVRGRRRGAAVTSGRPA